MKGLRSRKVGKDMLLKEEERRFLEEVVFSAENTQKDFERWCALIEEDYANSLFSCSAA